MSLKRHLEHRAEETGGVTGSQAEHPACEDGWGRTGNVVGEEKSPAGRGEARAWPQGAGRPRLLILRTTGGHGGLCAWGWRKQGKGLGAPETNDYE